MTRYMHKLACSVGVQPGYIEGQESQGLNYFTWHDSGTVGAQCSVCNTIIWLESIENRILSEARPANIPTSGSEYRDYYKMKLKRFLTSLPNCPSCGESSFDRFINNVNYPRFLDGTEIEAQINKLKFLSDESTQHQIWWLGD